MTGVLPHHTVYLALRKTGQHRDRPAERRPATVPHPAARLDLTQTHKWQQGGVWLARQALWKTQGLAQTSKGSKQVRADDE